MKWMRFLGASALFALVGCQTAQQAKEIKLIGFEENVSKGTSLGPIEGGDCVFHVLGYWLGGQPTLSRALMNARTGKTTSIGDSMGGGSTMAKGGARYFNNVVVTHDGFNAGIFGKQCINITAMGFK